MGTAFAGIVRTPLTSVIMIFEMTRDYSIIVPLMISNLIAFYISQRLQREPIYEALALRTASTCRATRRAATFGRPRGAGDAAGPPLEAGAEQVPVVAPDAHLHPDHSLSVALERLGASGHQQLPVVSRADAPRVLGVVTLDAVLAGFRLRAGDPLQAAERRRPAGRIAMSSWRRSRRSSRRWRCSPPSTCGSRPRNVSKPHTTRRRLFAEGQRLERAGRADPPSIVSGRRSP